MYMVNRIYVFKMVGSYLLSAHFRNCQKQSKPEVIVVGVFVFVFWPMPRKFTMH